MKKKSLFIVFLSLMLLFSISLTACSSADTSAPAKKNTDSNMKNDQGTAATAPAKSSMLEKVKERGKVVVGVNGKLPGFGYVDSNGKYTGFDVDFARALAAAIFNDPNAVEFRPLSAQERFTALQTGEIDVLIRNTTWTLSRDTQLGANFAPITFYDGQGIMVRKDSGINSLKDLEGARIGVETGTTTELNLADQLRKLNINYKPVVFDDANAMIAAYEKGSLDAWTTDKSGLVSRLSTLSDPSKHKILKETLSKEPLGPVVLHGDDQWFDIVKWTTFATIEAEELGITQKNIDTFMSSKDPVVRRFLGLDGDLGEQLGLTKDFAVRITKSVGNYGEIFDRYLGHGTIFNLDRGLNNLWTNGGLLYSPPFR